MFGKNGVGNKSAVLLAEFLGTGALTYVVLSLQHSSIGVPLFIAIAAGLALAAVTFTFVNNSGAHFNPAITIGMWTARQIKTLPALAYVVVQVFGAWVAYELFAYLFNSSSNSVMAYYASQPAFNVKTFTAEAVGALIFTLVWAAALHRVKVGAAFAGFVGVAFTVGILIASVAGFGLINPALALGSRAWHIWGGAGWGTYVLGPVVGSVVGFNLYEYFFKDGAKALVGASAGSRASTVTSTSTSKSKSSAKKTSKASSRKKR